MTVSKRSRRATSVAIFGVLTKIPSWYQERILTATGFPSTQATGFMSLDASLAWDFCYYFVQHHIDSRCCRCREEPFWLPPSTIMFSPVISPILPTVSFPASIPPPMSISQIASHAISLPMMIQPSSLMRTRFGEKLMEFSPTLIWQSMGYPGSCSSSRSDCVPWEI